MAHQIVSRGPFTGRGRTLTEARADLDRQLDAWLRVAGEPPVVVAWRGETMMAHRTPGGWESGRIEGSDFRVTCAQGPAPREEVQGSLAFTLAQRLWDGEEEAPEVLAPFQGQAREFRAWAQTAKRHQAATSALRSAGVVEGWLRRYADEVTFVEGPLDKALDRTITEARRRGHVSQGALR